MTEAGGYTITGIPIIKLVAYFLGYIILHVLIGKTYKKKEAEMVLRDDNTSVEYFEQKKMLNYYRLAFKWFPAVYVIFILVTI